MYISSEAQKKMQAEIWTMRFKEHFLISRIMKPFITKPLHMSINDRPTDKVYYILDAHWYRDLHQKNQPSILNNSCENRIFPIA